VEQEDRRSDGYSQRLYGPARSSEAERQFGWRPEYLQEAKEEVTEVVEDLRPKFPPTRFKSNCLIVWKADWCSACKKMGPTIKQLRAEGYAVYILDYDYYYDLAQKMHIQALPTCIVHKDSREVSRHRGVVSADALKKTLTKN
jgi:thioredoxin-like negative regulator of GroEL